METMTIGSSDLQSSRLVYGCMRIASADSEPADGLRALDAAVAAGYTHFDHADIYGGGACEKLFGEFLSGHPGLRESIVITSKCGVRLAGSEGKDSPKRYRLDSEFLQTSVDASLARLQTTYLDMLLLHRPDYLLDAGDIAAAFAALRAAGKVRHFGVSNFAPSQLAFLQSRLDVPLQVNQVEVSLANITALGDGTLDQCQQLRMTPQAWSPLAGSIAGQEGGALDDPTRKRLEQEFGRQAAHYGCDTTQVALAWLLRHPAGVSPVIGSTNPHRIAAAVTALDIDYSANDWYRLLEARTGQRVP